MGHENKDAAKRAGRAIERQFALLASNSEIGRHICHGSDLRELVIHFGGLGYIALYNHDITADVIDVLAFRHQKAAGY